MPMRRPPVSYSSQNQVRTIPPVETLFSESFSVAVKSVIPLLKLMLVFIPFLVVFILLLFGLFWMTGSMEQLINWSRQESMSGIEGLQAFLNFGVASIVALIVFSFICSAFQIAGLIIINDPDRQRNSLSALRQGASKVVGMIILSLVVGFLVAGGFFALIIPGIVFVLLFWFSITEYVLTETTPIQALRRSMTLVSSHFSAFIGRLLLFLLLQIVVGFLLSTVIEEETTSSVIRLIVGLISALFNIFALAYYVTLYKHLSVATPRSQAASLLWVIVTAVIGWALLFIGLYSSARFLTSPQFLENIQKGRSLQRENRVSNTDISVTELEATVLASDVFAEANAYRAEQNLPALVLNNRLCAYATRRTEQVAEFGKYDDGKGFYEDNADEKIRAAYFSGFAQVSTLDQFQVSKLLTSKHIVTGWSDDEGNALDRPDMTEACVRATPQYLVMVLASK